MPNIKNPEVLVFLGRNNISFFESPNNLTKTLPIPETALKDMEIVDSNLLGTLIRDFLEKEKFNPAAAIIVISDSISFTENASVNEENKEGVLIQDFTDNIPLEFPEIKIFKEGSSAKAVAVNPKYYQVVIESLTAKGFSILGVIPASLIPEILAATTISLDIAKKVLTNFDKIKYQNFIETSKINIQAAPQKLITTQKPKGPRIYILIGIMILLGIALLAVILLVK